MAEKTAQAKVASGRTVQDDKKVYAAGETVELPESEVARLRALGFLEPAPGDAAPVEVGPTVSSEDGPKVTKTK